LRDHRPRRRDADQWRNGVAIRQLGTEVRMGDMLRLGITALIPGATVTSDTTTSSSVPTETTSDGIRHRALYSLGQLYPVFRVSVVIVRFVGVVLGGRSARRSGRGRRV
jgi:hypothetical protein